MRVCVLIPAYNEENSVSQVIAGVRRHSLDVIVVDDGSTDATGTVAAQAGATAVLRHVRNGGKGTALRTGFLYISRQGYDAAVIMDADGQHNPEEIPRFLSAAAVSAAGILIGNRMDHPTGMPLVRRLTNRFTSWCISRLIGVRVPDTQCGFRLVRRNVLESVALSTGRYDTESELLIEAAGQGVAIESIPVQSVYASEKSRIDPVRDTIRFWRLLLKKSRRAFYAPAQRGRLKCP